MLTGHPMVGDAGTANLLDNLPQQWRILDQRATGVKPDVINSLMDFSRDLGVALSRLAHPDPKEIRICDQLCHHCFNCSLFEKTDIHIQKQVISTVWVVADKMLPYEVPETKKSAVKNDTRFHSWQRSHPKPWVLSK
ncbi:MAG: hypothetical protein R3E79_17205 [Caldilineaceae bacterium]